MESLGWETGELSLYDTIADIVPEDLFGFVEKHVKSDVNLNTPVKSPPGQGEVDGKQIYFANRKSSDAMVYYFEIIFFKLSQIL